MKWFIGFLILLTFALGYGLRMYQHPIQYQTEQEKIDAGWYKEYILEYVPPEYGKEKEKPKPNKIHKAPNERLQPKLKKLN